MILGLTPAGLFLLREFSKAGKKVVAVGLKDNVGLYSRYGCKIALSKLTEIEDIFSKYLHKNIVIHISSDAFINYLIDKNHSIFRTYQCFPNYTSAKIFSDKILTGKLADKLKISYPHMYRLDEINPQEYDHYPLILKWNRRKKIDEPFKTILIRSPNELINIKVLTEKYKEEVVLQRYIPGGPEVNLSYGGYYQNGEEKLSVAVTQKRQYPHGLSSFVEEYKGKFIEEIRNIAKKLISELSFNGFVEVEFRIDVSKNKLYLIEVNPRTWGWIKILKRKYRGLNIDLLTWEKVESDVNVCFINAARDIRAIIDMKKKQSNQIKLKNVISDYRKRPIMDILEFDDLKPFIYQLKKFF